MLNEIQHIQETAQLLHTERQVEAALDTMARQINIALADKNPLVLCVMNGGIVVAGKLLPRLTMSLTLDAINASRYQNKTVGQTIAWVVKPSTTLKDRTVLIVDDILDAGITLKAIYDYCFEQGATAVYSAVLVNKLLDHEKPITADFIGLDVENHYVFGYGMDYKGYLRNAAGIYAAQQAQSL
ncbi:hypoxanthine-guanine phosphoribosyltransferase [Crenothrix polyspora]|uniref:Phosphoribosyltransferase n=1 Tax=Crenothrix polyspora TaxID=360316 RepID=A0A1R4H2X4_9GAMM|nr:hypoxanthine-guanine phosphoribosyltransferase [Crenothrix polyspora]SJM90603.1 Phosphoribosyltransferase [Crenothrix polyspora]